MVRAWLEAGSSSPLRAEVRLTTDVSRGIEETLTLADADSITAAVSVWLHRMVVCGTRSCPSVANWMLMAPEQGLEP